jgi:hypothetical protein
MKRVEFLKNINWPSWTPIALAVLGAFVYLIQALTYSYTTVSSLDEGSYLLKGILYLRGVYEPFEPYGPLTNKAPFAFLIPGFVQYIFGAGLRTGRFFVIFLGLLTLLGVWITAKRWSTKWVATGSVWVFALSSMVIKTYSVAVSEVIIACLLAWMCVCVLGHQRPLWQVILGSLLAALAVMTRQNMAPVLVLLILYIFWEHGKQKGIWALVAGSVFFIAVHIYYWPHILSIWAPWLPESLTPFLDPYRLPKDAIPIWDPSIDFWNRMNAFFQGIRYHFIIIVGSIFALIFWPRQSDWKSASDMRAAVFLAVLYFTLFIMHGWASLASQYESYSCVFCFTNYLAFFAPLGILLVVIVFSQPWRRSSSQYTTSFVIFLIVLISTGIGFSIFESVGQMLLNFPIPRFREGQFLLDTVAIVDVLTQKFGLKLPEVRRVISSGVGFLIGSILVATVFYLWRSSERNENQQDLNHLLVNSFLIAGFILTPFANFKGSHFECDQDLLTANEQLGAHLASVIPPNSLVYWDGGLSFTPMLYVPDVHIFPPQINDGYAYRRGGDPDALFRFGYWNSVLLTEWRDSADIFIIEAKRYASWRDFLNPQEFEEYQKPTTAPSCHQGADLRIFHRLP